MGEEHRNGVCSERLPFHEYAWVAGQPIGPMRTSVLFHLASAWNFKTGQCNPSAKTIAKRIGSSERSVRYALDDLEALGLVGRRRTRYSFSFRLNFDRFVTEQDIDGLPPRGSRPAESAELQERQDVPLSDSRAAEYDGQERHILPTNPLENPLSELPPIVPHAGDILCAAEEEPTMDEHLPVWMPAGWGLTDDGRVTIPGVGEPVPMSLARRLAEAEDVAETQAQVAEDLESQLRDLQRSLASGDATAKKTSTKRSSPLPVTREWTRPLLASTVASLEAQGFTSTWTDARKEKCLKLMDALAVQHDREIIEETYSALDMLDLANEHVGLTSIEYICSPKGFDHLRGQYIRTLRARAVPTLTLVPLKSLDPDVPFSKMPNFDWPSLMPMAELDLSSRIHEHCQIYAAITNALKAPRSVTHFRHAYQDLIRSGRKIWPRDLTALAIKANADASDESRSERMKASKAAADA